MGLRKYVMILGGLAGAAFLSQFPAFHQQYLQRIGGTLDEVNRQIDALDDRAAEQGLDRYGYIRRFLNNTDASVHSEGLYLENLLVRQIRIRQSIEKLREAPAAMQLPILVQYLDTETAQGVMDDFVPALNLSTTGLIYAGSGFGAGFLGTGFLTVFIPRRRRKAAAKKKKEEKTARKERREPQITSKHPGHKEDEHPYRMP